jgi:hypothetical protein
LRYYVLKKSELTAKGGPKPKLGFEDMLLAALEYLHEYRTYAHTAVSCGMSESSIFRIIKWVEDTLISDGTFSLPGRKVLLKSDTDIEVVIIDAAETPIERPKKDRDFGTPVKKKRHTMKAQVVVNKKTKEIIRTDFANGRRHDFRLYKESKVRLAAHIEAQADTGFQGVMKLHKNSVIPKKRSKKNPLCKEDKKRNHEISSSRVLVENIIGFIKRFYYL